VLIGAKKALAPMSKISKSSVGFSSFESVGVEETMSELDRRALEASFTGWKADRVPEMSDSEAFEWFTIGLLFKDSDLSDQDISSGMTGGGGMAGLMECIFSSIGSL
jgi:hypothetical protein